MVRPRYRRAAARTVRAFVVTLVLTVGTAVVTVGGQATDAQAAARAGFHDTTVLSGLDNPTAVRFSPDKRVFVAEKSGLVRVFDSLADPTPSVFANLRTQVHNYNDRGLLGLALDPQFPTRPYVYVSYTHDAAIGGTAPRWGQPGVASDPCPTPPGPATDGCVVSGRVSRLTASGNRMTAEKVLVEDYCQQFPSHSMGDLRFGADGALYASGGEGAHYNFPDYGQIGNPCGDPPGPKGTDLGAPTARGGALRAQSARRPAGDPVSLGGSVVRIDPATGRALTTNPFASDSNAKRRRIYAYGFRNPFRMAVRPGTSEVWVGDVGWGKSDEIDRLPQPGRGVARNYGWPCYEGNEPQWAYLLVGLDACDSLVASTPGATKPYFAYLQNEPVVAGDGCSTSTGSSVTGLAFYDRARAGADYPASYTGALFFADASRGCVWAMRKGTDGLPDPARTIPFVTGAANPVDLEIGPGGDLYYVDVWGGTVHRVSYIGADHPPVARLTATPDAGDAPLQVAFDGRASSDADPGDTLRYAWDLDADGAFDDGTGSRASFTYTTPGTKTARLRVTDPHGVSDTASTTVAVANVPPEPRITTPTSQTTWAVGEVVPFAGGATDAQDGAVPASRLSWDLVMHHCQSGCHEHLLQTFAGVASGSFAAPDHEYPSYLELRLTARDSTGATATTSVTLQPRTVTLELRSVPEGLSLSTAYGQQTTPYSLTVIAGSANTLTAVTPQTLAGTQYTFDSWSDGGSATHQVTAPSSGSATYTATYRPAP